MTGIGDEASGIVMGVVGEAVLQALRIKSIAVREIYSLRISSCRFDIVETLQRNVST
jgi:hypothetical protein